MNASSGGDFYDGIDLDVVDRWTDKHVSDVVHLSRHGLLDPVFNQFGTLVPGHGVPGEALARVLATLDRRGELLLDQAVMVMWAWAYSQYPRSVLTDDQWRSLFRAAGYVEGFNFAQRPSAPITLYRGATDEGRLGWSWTSSPATAGKYATEVFKRPPSLIWVATVEPERVLGHFAERGEQEFVVDTAGMTVEPYQSAGSA